MDKAVKAAQKAFEGLAKILPRERAKFLEQLETSLEKMQNF